MMWTHGDRMLEVSGSREQRARAQGEFFRPHVHRMFKEGFSDLLPRWTPAWLVRAALRIVGGLYLRWHRPLYDDPARAHHRSALEALARAAGMAPATLYGFHAVESETANLGFSMGCTSLAFGPHCTADGAPRLAYNHDFPPAFERFLFLRRSTPDDGYRSLAVTYPCLMGAINGVNEHGLAVSVNQAFATDIERRRPALFVTMLVQECLESCRDVAEAVTLLRGARVAAGCIVSLVDASGERAAVELSNTRATVRRAADDDEVLYTFNNYRVPSMREVEVPVGAISTGLVSGLDIHRCNVTRERAYLARVRGGERWDDGAIQQLLSDHDGGAGDSDTICRHDDPLSETILSTIIDTRARTMKLLWGRPCEKGYAVMHIKAHAVGLRSSFPTAVGGEHEAKDAARHTAGEPLAGGVRRGRALSDSRA
ncbi:MAG: hypothetical protein KC503_36695 [Myxococcales bacterium]|nr:hypothetical protein [Myxococcales bacterium]